MLFHPKDSKFSCQQIPQLERLATMMLADLRRSYKFPSPFFTHFPHTMGWKEIGKASVLPSLSSIFPHLSLQRSLLESVENKSSPSSLPSKALRLGVILSGGPAPGGHSVIAGIFDILQKLHPQSVLYGFLGGIKGLIEGNYKKCEGFLIEQFRHQGGFDLLGSGRDKLDKKEDKEKALHVLKKMDLQGLIIIGGDDSNTNAAILAEYLLSQQFSCKVVGVPKTIDADLWHPSMPLSFGFDTATKTYAEMVGNIAKDALSMRKYYHFIKLMGRQASHIALEVALQTQPSFLLLSEEKKSLFQIVEELKQLILQRREQKKEFGLILIPEAVGESIEQQFPSRASLEKDAHGNTKLSLIDTTGRIIDLLQEQISFSSVSHFFGYEGRSCFPTDFDAAYSYVLGVGAALMVHSGLTGVMVGIPNIQHPCKEWKLHAIPLIEMLHLEKRKDSLQPVIEKTLVQLNSPAYLFYKKEKEKWEQEDLFVSPGPIQFSPSYPDKPFTLPLSVEMNIKEVL